MAQFNTIPEPALSEGAFKPPPGCGVRLLRRRFGFGAPLSLIPLEVPLDVGLSKAVQPRPHSKTLAHHRSALE